MGEIGATSGTQCSIEYLDMLNRIEASGVFRAWIALGRRHMVERDLSVPHSDPSTATTTPHMKYLLEYVNQ